MRLHAQCAHKVTITSWSSVVVFPLNVSLFARPYLHSIECPTREGAHADFCQFGWWANSITTKPNQMNLSRRLRCYSESSTSCSFVGCLGLRTLITGGVGFRGEVLRSKFCIWCVEHYLILLLGSGLSAGNCHNNSGPCHTVITLFIYHKY